MSIDGATKRGSLRWATRRDVAWIDLPKLMGQPEVVKAFFPPVHDPERYFPTFWSLYEVIRRPMDRPERARR